MNRLLFAIISALALGISACVGWFTVDGFELRYVDRPAIEGHRRFVHRGLAVYEVDGRYYREQENRWVEYRERPRDLQEDHR